MDNLSELKNKAIKAALEQNWEEALRLNLEIAKLVPQDIETKNRLAKAYCELGELDKSKKLYGDVLKLDPYNQIALKNTKLLARVNGKTNGIKTNGSGHGNGKVDFSIFLSEPGKTKLINLVHLATPQVLSNLSAGNRLEFVIKRHCVQLTTEEKEYIGALPDDVAHLLLSLVRGGNKYEAYVKKITANSLWIILWEKFRAKRFVNQPSFLDSGKMGYIPFVKEEAVKKEPLDMQLEEDQVEEQEEVETPIEVH